MILLVTHGERGGGGGGSTIRVEGGCGGWREREDSGDVLKRIQLVSVIVFNVIGIVLGVVAWLSLASMAG